jgi:hypothetical protein
MSPAHRFLVGKQYWIFHNDLGFSLAHPTQLVGWAGLIWENLYIKAMSPAHRFLVGKQYWIFHNDLGFSLAHPTQLVGWAGLIWENLYIKAMSPAHRFLVGKQYWIFSITIWDFLLPTLRKWSNFYLLRSRNPKASNNSNN